MRGSLWICASFVGLFSLLPAKAEEAADPDAARRARAFATVGEETITVGDLEDMIGGLSPFLRARFTEPEVLKRFADEQLNAMLLRQGAKSRGLNAGPEVTRLVDEAMVQMFLREAFDEKTAPEDVPEEEVRAFYEANPAEFNKPELRRASHILVDDRETAKALIEALTDADARAFVERAKEMSLDTETKLRGGDLLFFAKDGKVAGRDDSKVDAGLVSAAFALERAGDLAPEPIAVGERWSVLKLTALRQAQVRSLKDAEASIRRRIWRQKRKAALDAQIEALRAELEPEIFPERMAPIRFETTADKGPQAATPGAAH